MYTIDIHENQDEKEQRLIVISSIVTLRRCSKRKNDEFLI